MHLQTESLRLLLLTRRIALMRASWLRSFYILFVSLTLRFCFSELN